MGCISVVGAMPDIKDNSKIREWIFKHVRDTTLVSWKEEKLNLPGIERTAAPGPDMPKPDLEQKMLKALHLIKGTGIFKDDDISKWTDTDHMMELEKLVKSHNNEFNTEGLVYTSSGATCEGVTPNSDYPTAADSEHLNKFDTQEEVEKKFGNLHSISASLGDVNFTILISKCKKCFLVSLEGNILTKDHAIMGVGIGDWMTGQKAKDQLDQANGRGFQFAPCSR